MADHSGALKHILVINDWGWMVTLLSQLLAMEGFFVTGRLRETVTVSTVANLHPDAIVLDIPDPPDPAIEQLLSDLAHDPVTTSIPLVLTCTTVPYVVQEADDQVTLHGRSVTVVREPYTVTTLIEAVTRSVVV